ncbi:hypothetical protein ACKFKG_10120 [Phormidesmis sp. 146-35]
MAMLSLTLKSSFARPIFAGTIGLLSACTPLPTTRSVPIESPRPIPTLPAERLIAQQAANPKAIAPSPPATPKAGKPDPTKKLSAADVTALLAEAEDKAVSAANLSQSAQSKEDWALVIKQWNRAIALLKPATNTNLQKSLVQQRLTTYQTRLRAAQQQAKTNPRQLIKGSGGNTTGGTPLILGPASPSPTASPTASPKASPTASPTGSPTPLPVPPPPKTQ